MTCPTKIFTSKQQGVTLLLAILVLASILAISFSLATILFVEVRSSGDLARTEPALYGAEALVEAGVYKTKRQVPDNQFSYPTSLGQVQLNNPPPQESSLTTPVYQDVVLPNTNFSNTTNHYILAPASSSAGSGYGQIKLTYLDNGNSSPLTVYICQYDQNLPYDPNGGLPYSYNSIVCSNPNDTANGYWLAKNVSLSLSGTSSQTWTLDPNQQQELILFDSDNSPQAGKIYVQIQAFGPAPSYAPMGIPYLNKKAIEINAQNQTIQRQIRAIVPIGGL